MWRAGIFVLLAFAGCARFTPPGNERDAKVIDAKLIGDGGMASADSAKPPSDSALPDTLASDLGVNRSDASVDTGIPDRGDDALMPDARVDTLSADASVDSRSPDATVDSRSPDATVDSRSPDATVDSRSPDATVDSRSPDATVDSRSPDASVDSRSPDATVDMLTPDSTAPPADATVDQGSPGPFAPCGATAVEIGRVGEMVACETTGGNVDQCNAESLCNTLDRQLCTTTEYRALYASSAPPAELQGAWIAGCAYNGASGSLLPAICAACSSQIAFNSPCSWTCGITGGSCPARRYVGVISGTSCNSLGVYSTATEGFWTAIGSDSLRSRALCCPKPSGFHGQWATIPAGSFSMGSPSNESCREQSAITETQHAVTLTRSFEITTTETSQGDFQQVRGYNPSSNNTCGTNCPVENLTWHEAAAYCNALSAERGVAQCFNCAGSGISTSCTIAAAYAGSNIYTCPGYRLPTEAEWEYAYRAGTTTAYYSGPNNNNCVSHKNLDAIGWYSANSGGSTKASAQLDPNAWGLYDMAGNVFEFCHDSPAEYGTASVVDPVNFVTFGKRVTRGGHAGAAAWLARAANRGALNRDQPFSTTGFRCVRTK